MNWLASLFGSNPIKTVSDAISTFTWTDEQQTKAEEVKLDALTRYVEASQPYNVARRFIAITLTILFIFLILLCIIAYPFSKTYAEYIYSLLSNVLITPQTWILGFYFAGGLITKARR